MKITPDYNITPSKMLDQAKKNQAPGATSFGSVLQETMDKAAHPDANQVAPPTIDALTVTQFRPPVSVGNVSTIDQTANMLDKLEAYSQKLADPDVSLKQLYPLLEEIEADKADLMPQLDKLPEGDNLKSILEQVLSAASIESVKFRRGDYNM